MRHLKKVLAFAVSLCTAFSFASCAASGITGEWDGSRADLAFAGDAAAGEYAPSFDVAEGVGQENGSETFLPQPGQLTAGEWNDNKNYDFFRSLFSIGEWCLPDEYGNVGTAQNGIFAEYQSKNAWGMYAMNRIEVSVIDSDGKPASGAPVYVAREGVSTLLARSDANGKAFLFPDDELYGYLYEHTDSVQGGYETENFSTANRNEEGVYEITLKEERRAYTQLDLCFMIDTTGSMGDELSYLQSEVGDVISRVQTELPDADVFLALVFYRDKGDEYVVRTSDFTSDISAQQNVLKAERAAGGGDYPEAVHEAFAAALGLSWRENSRKILIPVLDAPPHDSVTEQDVLRDIRSDYGELVYEAAAKGVSAVPVAASGTNALAQYLLRSTALVTGGTYVFLTDDSGIGYFHDTPSVGEFTVEYLNSCLVRVIGELYDGKERSAVYYKQDTDR